MGLLFNSNKYVLGYIIQESYNPVKPIAADSKSSLINDTSPIAADGKAPIINETSSSLNVSPYI